MLARAAGQSAIRETHGGRQDLTGLRSHLHACAYQRVRGLSLYSPGLLCDFSPVSLVTLAYLMLTLEETSVYFDLNFCPIRCLSALLMTAFT